MNTDNSAVYSFPVYLHHVNPVHTNTTHLFKIRFNISLGATSFQVVSSLHIFWSNVYIFHLSHECFMFCPFIPPRFGHTNRPNVRWRGYKLWRFSLYKLLYPRFTSYLVDRNIIVSNLFSNIYSRYSSHSDRPRFTHVWSNRSVLVCSFQSGEVNTKLSELTSRKQSPNFMCSKLHRVCSFVM
jgi:hypothetical protein